MLLVIAFRKHTAVTVPRDAYTSENLPKKHLESDHHTPAGQAILGVVGCPRAIVADGLLPRQVVLVQHCARVLSVDHNGKQGNQKKGVTLHGGH